MFLLDIQQEEESELRTTKEEVPKGYDQEPETFWTEYGTINGLNTIGKLRDKAIQHAVTKVDSAEMSDEGELHENFLAEKGRYSDDEFCGIMPDSGASGISTAGRPQVEALKKIDKSIRIVQTIYNQIVRFGKGIAAAEGHVIIRNPIGKIKFWVVPAETPFFAVFRTWID